MPDEDNQEQIEELTPTEQELFKQAIALRKRNSKFIHQLQQQMGGQLDVTHMRIDHFIDSLVNLGIMTREQSLVLRLSWEQNLRKVLLGVREDLMNQAQAQAVRGLTLPARPGGIILPNGSVHRGKTRPDHKR